MEQVLSALFVYVFLLVVFRILGKRSLGQITTFDFVLLLIISETTQGALVGQDGSLTTFAILVSTLLGVDLLLSLAHHYLPALGPLVEGVPLVIVEHGRPVEEHMRKARVNEAEVLSAARLLQGLGRMEDIEYAVLEQNGSISIIPRQSRG